MSYESPNDLIVGFYVNRILELAETDPELEETFDYIEENLSDATEEIIAEVTIKVGRRLKDKHKGKYILFLVYMYGPDTEDILQIDRKIIC
jgi:hypothetical protein